MSRSTEFSDFFAQAWDIIPAAQKRSFLLNKRIASAQKIIVFVFESQCARLIDRSSIDVVGMEWGRVFDNLTLKQYRHIRQVYSEEPVIVVSCDGRLFIHTPKQREPDETELTLFNLTETNVWDYVRFQANSTLSRGWHTEAKSERFFKI